MVKNAKPWAFDIIHLKEHLGVITAVAIFTYIIPDPFFGLRRKPSYFHPKGEAGMGTAINGMDG
jgi:hypothetical protein